MSLSVSSMASPEKGGGEVGFDFEEGMSWLPSPVVHEAFDTKAFDTKAYLGRAEQHLHHNQHNYQDQLYPKFCSSRSSFSPHYVTRPKDIKNWVSGGHGMQAVFLDSSNKSRGGTGVFLPQRAGTNFYSKKKPAGANICRKFDHIPACAPVLLPDRVIQALNLNVHALGLHISPKDRHRKRFKSGHEDDTQDCMSPRNKMSGSNEDEQCYIISENQTNSSPESCLPKEWTY